MSEMNVNDDGADVQVQFPQGEPKHAKAIRGLFISAIVFACVGMLSKLMCAMGFGMFDPVSLMKQNVVNVGGKSIPVPGMARVASVVNFLMDSLVSLAIVLIAIAIGLQNSYFDKDSEEGYANYEGYGGRHVMREYHRRRRQRERERQQQRERERELKGTLPGGISTLHGGNTAASVTCPEGQYKEDGGAEEAERKRNAAEKAAAEAERKRNAAAAEAEMKRKTAEEAAAEAERKRKMTKCVKCDPSKHNLCTFTPGAEDCKMELCKVNQTYTSLGPLRRAGVGERADDRFCATKICESGCAMNNYRGSPKCRPTIECREKGVVCPSPEIPTKKPYTFKEAGISRGK